MQRRFIHKSWINHPPESRMSDATTMDRMRLLADGMERRELYRHGVH